MSSRLPFEGEGLENDAQEAPNGTAPKVSHVDKSRSTRHAAKSRPRGRASQAIDDAQQGLSSLLNPPTDDAQPRIISRSGAIRNETRGRIAGPNTPAKSLGSGRMGPSSGYLIEAGREPEDSSLSLVTADSSSLSWKDVRSESRAAPHLARVNTRLQVVRERASLLVNAVDGSYELDELGNSDAIHASRRSASQWATRYATHLVVVLVVAALVAMGGLKSLTVQGAYPNGLHAADAFTGTDHFDDEAGFLKDGQTAIDSQDYQIALPRTELSGAEAADSQLVAPGKAQNTQDQSTAPGNVTQYKVAAGDSVEAIAAKFNLLPETVMGSNGIFDSEEALQEGRSLIIPPVDGMYYVAAEGDTVETVADKFQVDPAVITAYAGNNLDSGVVKPGQALVIPGGMIPARESVVTYTVRRGDSLKGIAARFGVDVPTMLNSNDINDPDNLQPGSELRVLPVPGIEYKVRRGDTINGIAEQSGVTPQMILDYAPNNLQVGSKLQVDQVIMVPGGSPEEQIVVAAARVQPPVSSRGAENLPARPEPPKKVEVKPVKPQATAVVGSASKSAAKPPAAPVPPAPKPTAKPKEANTPKSGTGRMVWPVSGTITQYFSSRHNGLDIAIRAGTPIHAADSGKVIWSGWRTDGLGYCVMIDHLNGLVTVYGHMIRQPAVYVGQYVSRSQVIGYIGSTGHSTGPHVHFMVKSGGNHNYRNPLAYLGG